MFCSAHSTILPPSQGEEAAEIRKKISFDLWILKKKKDKKQCFPFEFEWKNKSASSIIQLFS